MCVYKHVYVCTHTHMYVYIYYIQGGGVRVSEKDRVQWKCKQPTCPQVRDAPISYMEYADGLSLVLDRHVCHVTSVASLVTN